MPFSKEDKIEIRPELNEKRSEESTKGKRDGHADFLVGEIQMKQTRLKKFAKTFVRDRESPRRAC